MTSNRSAILFDDSDKELLSKYEWRVVEDHGNHYAIAPGKVRMHRLLVPCDGPVDHKNGNGLDNRRDNLRCSTSQNNNRNRKSVTGTRSIYKGVYFDKKGNKWRARIFIGNGKYAYNGSYVTDAEAAHAYDELARIHYGEYAALNFPKEGETSALR